MTKEEDKFVELFEEWKKSFSGLCVRMNLLKEAQEEYQTARTSGMCDLPLLPDLQKKVQEFRAAFDAHALIESRMAEYQINQLDTFEDTFLSPKP